MKATKVERVMLELWGRRVILHGSVHVGPRRFYEAIQELAFRLERENYAILYEDIIDIGGGHPPRTKNEERLRICFGAILVLYKAVAKKKNLETQEEALAYPHSASVVDMRFSDFTAMLDEAGVTCRAMLLYLNCALRIMSPARVFESVVFSILWFQLLRRAEPVLMGYRNRAVYEKIENDPLSKNAFVIYGDAHIPGIVSLLSESGWEVKERVRIALDEYYD
ncbi:hypothetical protein L0Y49_01815 [bacterium]|nr:hypothetical protein [bacterium]